MWNRTENQVGLVLIRHGETAANRERRYLGVTDEPLSDKGRSLLLSRKEDACYPGVQALFSSPMRRCLETAEILYPGIRPVIIPEWREMDFGRFEYCNYEELKHDREYQAWIDSGGTAPFPGGEDRETFLARCGRGFFKMLGELEQRNGITAGMIVHGGTIMALLSCYYGGAYFDYQVKNGGGYFCQLKGWGEDARITQLEELGK